MPYREPAHIEETPRLSRTRLFLLRVWYALFRVLRAIGGFGGFRPLLYWCGEFVMCEFDNAPTHIMCPLRGPHFEAFKRSLHRAAYGGKSFHALCLDDFGYGFFVSHPNVLCMVDDLERIERMRDGLEEEGLRHCIQRSVSDHGLKTGAWYPCSGYNDLTLHSPDLPIRTGVPITKPFAPCPPPSRKPTLKPAKEVLS